MRAANPCQVVHKLIAAADAPAWDRGRSAQAHKTTDNDCGQRLNARHQADARGIETLVQRAEELLEAVVTDAGLVDEPATVGLRKIQAGELHARGDNGLVGVERRAVAGRKREVLITLAEDVTAVEAVALAEAVVNLHQEIVASILVRREGDQIVRPGGVGRGK